MTEVVVIGAGPYGLSVAGQLSLRGIPYQVLGRPMEMWAEHMPRGMTLKSDGFASNFGALPLTLKAFCERTGRAYGDLGHRTPIADVLAYGKAVQDTYVGPVTDQKALSVAPAKGGFVVHTDAGTEVIAKRVVVATGLFGSEQMPSWPGMPADGMTHVSAHNDLSKFTGQRVAVIGAGQSAFESTALLHEQGAAHVNLLCRSEPIFYSPESEGVPSTWDRLRHPNWGLGPGWSKYIWSEQPKVFHLLPQAYRHDKAFSTFGPACSGWTVHRVRVPGVTIHTAEIVRVEAGRSARLGLVVREASGEQRIEVDHVLCATGYQPSLFKLGFLAPVMAERGHQIRQRNGLPELNKRFETSLPGLHVVGGMAAPAWGPSMRFIYGTNYAAPALVRNLGYAKRTMVGVPAGLRQQAA